MNLNIHFISFDIRWVDAISQLFSDISGITVTHGNIKSVPTENTVFVSPANSIGYMDGGIDYVLSREMFPGLQTIIQDSISAYGLVNGFGRHYLPVGSALCLQIRPTTHIIVAPTMFQPRDVSRTQNAYWSMLAALAVFDKQRRATTDMCDYTLVVTSHCCGYGCMDPLESAHQMNTAYVDFCRGISLQLDTESAAATFKVAFSGIDDGSSGRADECDMKEIYVTPS